jgi:hypothetical protein
MRRLHLPVGISGTRLWAVICCILLTSCEKGLPAPKNCSDSVSKCLILQSIDTLSVIKSRIDYWDNVLLMTTVFAGIAGTVATIMIALQGDNNRHWTRPVGIIATSLVTGITAMVTSFHIPENKDKYITAYGELLRVTNRFEHDTTQKQPNKQEADELEYKFVSDFTNVKLELLKTQGSFSLVVSPPQPSVQKIEQMIESGSTKSQKVRQPAS